MTEKCKICDSNTIAEVSFGNTKLLECKDCGVHFLQRFPDQSLIEDYYKTDYSITSNDLIETEFRKEFRKPEQHELIEIISKYIHPPASLLDIGCDKAFFIEEAAKYGFVCTGIEPSTNAIKYAADNGIELISDIADIPTKQDIAVMWHSLEHIPNPNSFLRELKQYLSPQAFLFIRIPAFDSQWRKLLGKYWIWFQPNNHFFHYSKKSLTILLERNGFQVMSIEHRKPNDPTTKRSYRTNKKLFKQNYNFKQNLRSTLIRKYEDITGIEIFAVAKLI